MSKNKISCLVVVVAILALVLVPSTFAGCKNNNGNIELPSQKEEDAAAAAAIIDKLASSTNPELPRMLLRDSNGQLRRNDGCSGSSCNILNDPCCGGCVCIPVGILVGVCAGSCC